MGKTFEDREQGDSGLKYPYTFKEFSSEMDEAAICTAGLLSFSDDFLAPVQLLAFTLKLRH